MQKRLIFILVFLLFVSLVYAHQPRLVYDLTNSKENSIILTNLNISQAFYGELKGQPDYYSFNTELTDFYTNILVPNLNNISTDYIVEISDKIILNGSLIEWKEFYEPFAGDSYLMGPEANFLVNGTNLIKVYNKNNQGKYVLVIGKKESFPIKEQFNTILVLPKLKTEFFNKSIFLSFYNYVGVYLLVLFIVLFFIIYLIRKFLKKQ